MLRFAFPLLLVLAVSPALAEAPLSRSATGVLTAPVRVGGREATPFVIDTGVAGCSVTQRFTTARRLPKVGAAADGFVLAPGVEIDGMPIGALRCAVTPDDAAAFDGIIGADALQRFVVVFDVPRLRLSLHGGAQHGHALVGPRVRQVDAQRRADGVLSVPVRFNNAAGAAVIATGAGRSVFNARFAAAAGTADSAFPPASAVRGVFQLAGTSMPIEAALTSMGAAEQPAMIFGLDRLAGVRLVIDYPRRRMWFDPR